MIDYENKQDIYEKTKKLVTKNAWEQILQDKKIRKVVFQLNKEGFYSSKTKTILTRFETGSYKLKSSSILVAKSKQNLEKMGASERNEYMKKKKGIASYGVVSEWFEKYLHEMDLSTFYNLIKEKPTLKESINKKNISKSLINEIINEMGSSFYYMDISLLNFFRVEILEEIKRMDEERLKTLFKKNALSFGGVNQFRIEEFFDGCLVGIEEMGESFLKKLFEIKVNDFGAPGFYLKDLIEEKLEIICNCDFKGSPVIVSSWNFSFSDFDEKQIQKLKKNNIVPMHITKKQLYLYGRGDYLTNLLMALSNNKGDVISISDVERLIYPLLETSEKLSMFESGIQNFSTGIYILSKYPEYAVEGDYINFMNVKEIEELNEKI